VQFVASIRSGLDLRAEFDHYIERWSCAEDQPVISHPRVVLFEQSQAFALRYQLEVTVNGIGIVDVRAGAVLLSKERNLVPRTLSARSRSVIGVAA